MKRYLIYALIALVVAAPLLSYFWYTREVDEVENAIVQIGFDPLTPPNKALTLGSFYYVSLDGSHPRPVCNAKSEVVAGMMETSPLPDFMASKLVDAHASLQTEMLRAVKAEAALEDQLTIQYSFKDTRLLRLTGEDLVSIERTLFEESNCEAAISEYINNVGLICQVQSAFMATVKYAVKRKDGHELAAEDIEKIKSALETTTTTQGMTIRETTIEGTGLVYGIMFKPKCVTDSDAGLVYPQSRMDRILLHARLLWRRMRS
ncbi:MAG TPA: hypothetical protein VNZ48_17580 [Xanthobacteraceae bacterium]|jgi:hypothetical protein|nr:hypothetical protein [Xanthobacteraceae bacterium]